MLSQTSNPQPPGPEHDRPWEADDAWPIGTFGEDYNVADAEGFRHGPWVRVYEDGGLYYVGEFRHGMPVNSQRPPQPRRSRRTYWPLIGSIPLR